MVENTNRERRLQRRRANREVGIHRDRFDPDLASKFTDISWMTEERLRYSGCVALHYNTQKQDYQDLDAKLVSTDAPAPRSVAESVSSEYERRATWDDVLKHFSLSDMLQITPLVVKGLGLDPVVDQVIDDFREKYKMINEVDAEILKW
jgi:hypothetical protein